MLRRIRTHVLLYSKTCWLELGNTIPNNSDMNNYKEIGNYFCGTGSSAATMDNTPFISAFTLKVVKGYSGNYVWQTFKELNTGKLAYRVFNGSTWMDFSYFSDNATISKYQTMDVSSDIIQTAENQTLYQTRFYWLNGTSYSGELPADSYKYGSAIVLKRASNSIFVVIFSIGKPIYNSYSNGSWSGWRDFTATLV